MPIIQESPLLSELARFQRTKGMAVIVSGPSGVGKDTLLDCFLPTQEKCVRLVTATTRPKREAELDGRDYIFLQPERFTELNNQGQFLETADVYGFMYGSPRWFVEEKRSEGMDVILKLDVQGGLAVKQSLPEAIMVFLAPPSMDELERRLRERRSETQEQLERRLGNARAEMELIPQYHYLIIDHTPEQAASELESIITAERLRVQTQPEY